jgi:hypothetical protein
MYDVVELDQDFGRWPAGTSGTIVDDFPGGYVVELSGPSGATVDLLSVRAGTIHVVQDASQVEPVSAAAQHPPHLVR